MNPRKRVPKKKLAMAYIVNGLTAQLMNRVSPTGRIALPACTTSLKSILTMMGYIMKNRQTGWDGGGAEDDPGHNAQADPNGQIALEQARHLEARRLRERVYAA